MNIAITEQYIYTGQCTYLNIGLLEAPRGTSFMAPFWVYTELGPAPILASMRLLATLVKRMLFIAFNDSAQVSPNVFCSPGGFLLMYK